jgi:thiol-disulfide isomerase/thioredoxin
MDSAFNNTNVVFLEESDFDSDGSLKIKTNRPVLVGILSSGCPWCHKVAPEIARLAKSRDLVVAVVVSDESPLGGKLLERVGASGVPTFVVFKDSKLSGVYDGPREAESFKRFALGQ